MGYIYIIKNKINSKVYIGQTKYTIKQRFKEHIYECKRNYDKELYKDMNDYGIDNFYINIIEKCDNDLLNDREIYWISFYDSYKNGYINLIKNYPFVKIGKMFDVSDNTIRKWCKKYDLPYKRKDIEKIKNK